MGVMDKLISYMNMSGRDSDDDSEYDYEDEEDFEEPAPKKSFTSRDTSYDSDDTAKKAPSKVTPFKAAPIQRKSSGGSGLELCVIKPQSFEDATEITDTLLNNNHAVVLNLEGVDVDIAQRIIDFASGSCYAINGNLQKISRYIFIITPSSVDISGDFQGLLGSTFDSPLNTGI